MINLNALNEKQQEAVNTLHKNVLVLAGAGTGKTKVLIYRIANLLNQGVLPKNICAFTFTNKAANEMKERLKQLVNIDNIEISTFHSFCFSYLVEFKEYVGYEKGFSLIDDEDKIKIIRNIINEDKLDIIDSEVVQAISAVKNHNIFINKNLKQSIIINYIFHKYENILLRSLKMDLDDLLYKFYKLLLNQNFIKIHLQQISQYILVDECQDTNKIQYEIIMLLSQIHNNVFLVGDNDQCIYTFRGSNLDNINNFIEAKKAQVIKLEENYRSNQNILEIANSLIKHNHHLLHKNLYTTRKTREFQAIYSNLETSTDEAIYTTRLINKLIEAGYLYNDIAILYRNNFVSPTFEKELIKQKIPYQTFGSYPFFKHKEIKTIFYYYQLLFNNDDDLAFTEIINIPKRKIGEVTLTKIQLNAKQKNISLYESAKQFEETTEFIQLIDFLSKHFKTLSPKHFINLFLEKIKYQDYLLSQIDSKSKINRLYDFIKMISDIEDYNNPNIATIDLLNQIYLKNKQDIDNGLVKLMTIHQAKGLEFKVVIIAGCNEGIIPSFKSSKNEIEEERRIFYVAITRAKERLYLLSADKRLVNGKYQYFKPSTFLENISFNNLYIDKIF